MNCPTTNDQVRSSAIYRTFGNLGNQWVINCPTTNGQVRSSAIYRTFGNYRIKILIFIKPRLPAYRSP